MVEAELEGRFRAFLESQKKRVPKSQAWWELFRAGNFAMEREINGQVDVGYRHTPVGEAPNLEWILGLENYKCK